MSEGDIEIKSTANQLKEFSDSLIWEDLRTELEVWKKMVGSEYDDVDSLLNLGKIQGRREAIDYFLELPRVLHETAKERQDESRRNKAK
jgi:hypothetical protein